MQVEHDYTYWQIAMVFLTVIFTVIGACVIMQGCSPTLTPAQEGDVQHHETTLSACRELALDARAKDASPEDSYALYEACKVEGGIK